ncbi:MAG TPA: hypothetical protein VI758_13645, partial [Bacteroidota bacterium]
IPDAFSINRAFNNGTPTSEYGAYVEAGYDLLYDPFGTNTQSLIPFVRYETMDLNASTPSNVSSDRSLTQGHFVAGVNYLPVPGVVLKGDVRLASSEGFATKTFLNLGIGLSF